MRSPAIPYSLTCICHVMSMSFPQKLALIKYLFKASDSCMESFYCLWCFANLTSLYPLTVDSEKVHILWVEQHMRVAFRFIWYQLYLQIELNVPAIIEGLFQACLVIKGTMKCLLAAYSDMWICDWEAARWQGYASRSKLFMYRTNEKGCQLYNLDLQVMKNSDVNKDS